MTFHARTACALSLAVALVSATGSGPAGASDILYVSITGKNSNACTLAQPCRSLQRAIKLAPAGGEIRILDSGFYGNNATIRKSLTISGNGRTVYLRSPITINHAAAAVTLRGLILNGRRTIRNGIEIPAATAVLIERCVIHDFAEHGITSGAEGVELFVTDSTVRNNSGHGVFVARAAGVTVDNSHLANNGSIGILVQNASAAINRSTASGNGHSGVAVVDVPSGVIKSTLAVQNGVRGFGASRSSITVDSSLAHGNGDGLLVTEQARARISNSTFTGNTTGINNGSGFRFVETDGNNTVRGNTTNTAGAPPVPIDGL